MRKFLVLAIVSVLSGCASSEKAPEVPPEVSQKYPAVTIETSGDLYYEDGGTNIQMDLFGNCAPGRGVIYIEIDKKKSATQCQNGRYRFSMNLPNTFFGGQGDGQRTPSSKYVMKEVQAYHGGHQKVGATSYILIDRRKKEVKSVINKQVKFERIPTGEYEPITQFNAFGSCASGSLLTLDITSPDRFGHQKSKYEEKKPCQDSGGFYFLSQVNGYLKPGTVVLVYEDVQSTRGPASAKKTKYKNVFKWSLPID